MSNNDLLQRRQQLTKRKMATMKKRIRASNQRRIRRRIENKTNNCANEKQKRIKNSTNHFSVTSCSSAVCFVRSDVRVLVFGCHVLRYRSASSTMCTLFFSYYMDYRNKNRIRCSTGEPNKAPKMKIKREKNARHLNIVPIMNCKSAGSKGENKKKRKKYDGSERRATLARLSQCQSIARVIVAQQFGEYTLHRFSATSLARCISFARLVEFCLLFHYYFLDRASFSGVVRQRIYLYKSLQSTKNYLVCVSCARCVRMRTTTTRRENTLQTYYSMYILFL